MQLRVLGFGLLQDADVGVGVFPEGEEIFVGGEGASAGEVSLGALPLCLKISRLQGISASYSQMG